MLDCEEQSLATIAEKMVDELVRKKEIRPGDRDGVLNALIQNRRLAQNPKLTSLKRYRSFKIK